MGIGINALKDGIGYIGKGIRSVTDKIPSWNEIKSGFSKKWNEFTTNPFMKIMGGIGKTLSFLNPFKSRKQIDLSKIEKSLVSIEHSLDTMIGADEAERKRKALEKKPEENKKTSSILDLLIGLGVGLVQKFKGLFSIFGKGISAFKRLGNVLLKAPGIVGSFIKKFTGLFKKLSTPLKWLGSGVSKVGGLFGKVMGIFGKIGKVFSPLLKLGPLFKMGFAFTKGIPIIGWAITAITSIIDFFKGFFKTEGSLFDKIKGGFGEVWNGLKETFWEMPKKALKWIWEKVTNIFSPSEEMKQKFEKTKEFFGNLAGMAGDWLKGKWKGLKDFFTGNEETGEAPFISKFTGFFSNIGNLVTDYVKKNPAVKGINWLWEKVSGKPLFDDVKPEERKEPLQLQPSHQIVQKTDSKGDAIKVLEESKKTAAEKSQRKQENDNEAVKELNENIKELTKAQQKALEEKNEEKTSSTQNISAPVINTTNNNTPGGQNIPDGIESLGIMLKNSTWGF